MVIGFIPQTSTVSKNLLRKIKLSAPVPRNTNTYDTQSGLPVEKKVNVLICLRRPDSSFSRQTNAISTKHKDRLFTPYRLDGITKTSYGHADAELCANTSRTLEMLFCNKIGLFLTSTPQLTDLCFSASSNKSINK
jgi:hypothetical protein